MGHPRRASSIAQANRELLDGVQGQIAFARRAPDEKAPAVVVPNYEHVSIVSYDVTIRNARPLVDELSLDREGFVLVQHKTSCAAVRDPEIMREKYLEEMVPFIKSYFNASWVVPRRNGVYVRRAAGTAIPKAGWTAVDGVREPAGLAHIDLAPVAGPVAAAAEDQLQGLPIRSYSRLMVIQAWRALSPPPQDFPLAFCDASTVRDSDMLVHDYVSNTRNEPGSAFKSCALRFSADQRWYYFPEMTADDLVLFKGYDSEEHYKPQAPHSAFDDRRAHPNAKPRESVEARFLVYYD
ncbi:CmcJ/NvfI family oxidoreductase [Bradyrhizobium sp. LMTR 3]|uniref:CmcJ/NvfI family oxidoreductase n=1 Tax=Bradyrhizobium sp. LMTR 3 TaxID=189873 RepID=UPI001FDA3AF7|nr:CmcJ/NvfI family oxidoreductase [Bradyrhizobium sp. LMTR 3]